MIKPIITSLAAVAASFALAPSSLHAAALASDNAGNYSNNYAGANSGSGFDAFVTTNNNTGGTGTYLGTSTKNGGGSSGGIDSGNGTAFGLYGNNGGNELVNRSFLADSNGQIALSVGQSFSLDFDNGYVTSGGSNVGFNLLGANGADRFTFQFFGGASTYVYNTGGTSTNTDTGVNYTAGGLHLVFTQSAANAFTVSIAPYVNGVLGTATILTGNVSAADISQFQIFNNNAANTDTANGPNYDLFFNNLAVVPEPSTLAAVAVGAMGLGLVVRRRRS